MTFSGYKPVFLASAAALLLISLGCSSGGVDTEQAKALGNTVANSMTAGEGPALSEEDRLCIGTAILKDSTVSDSDFDSDFSEWTDDQAAAAETATNSCVKGSAISGPLTQGFYSSLGFEPSSDAVESCVSTGLDGKVGTIAAELSDPESSAPSETLMGVFSKCVPEADITTLLTSSFQAEGFDAESAECIATALAADIGLADFVEINTQGTTAEQDALVEDATLACNATVDPAE